MTEVPEVVTVVHLLEEEVLVALQIGFLNPEAIEGCMVVVVLLVVVNLKKTMAGIGIEEVVEQEEGVIVMVPGAEGLEVAGMGPVEMDLAVMSVMVEAMVGVQGVWAVNESGGHLKTSKSQLQVRLWYL